MLKQLCSGGRHTSFSDCKVSSGDRLPIMVNMKSTLPDQALNGMTLSRGALAVLPQPQIWKQMKCRLVNAAFGSSFKAVHPWQTGVTGTLELVVVLSR